MITIAVSDYGDYTSLHTGDCIGFSWFPCSRCGDNKGGLRYQLVGLRQAKIGMKADQLGSCCSTCFEEVNI